MKAFITAVIAGAALISSAHATLIYDMDFSVPGQGSTHDSGGDALEVSPMIGTNWALTFGSLSTDSTTNEFITTGTLMRVQDWGGTGTITSSPIAIPSDGTVDIIGTGFSIGSDAFNAGGEGISWFYEINSGGPVTVVLDEAALGVGPVNAGTNVGNSFNAVAVAAGDTLNVGFIVDVDGADDGVEISALSVDFTAAVPEPSSALVLVGFLSSLVAGYRKRRFQPVRIVRS